MRRKLGLALENVTDFAWLRPGMRVAVKVNLVSGAHPDRAVTTHPAVACALCAILKERGADVVVGDSPGGVYNAAWVERVYAQCGMYEAEKYGAELNRDFSEKHVSDKNGEKCREFDCTAYLEEADAVISLCKLKTHGMMKLTAGVKNMFGAIPGAKKPEYHFRFPRHEDFADALVDICGHFRPVLTICDAVEAMEGNGPTAGTPRHVGYLAAAVNPHAMDECLARLIGLEPDSVPTLAAAKRRGLIPDKLSVLGRPEPLRDFVLPADGGLLFEGHGGIWGRLRSTVMSRVLQTRPELEKGKCVGCGKCAEICPAKAIAMGGGRPSIDRKKCIRCFCCQEFCPVGALYVGRTLPARLVNREVR
ncbi:MAG: DUF362 domain-containing protein [Candidatus Heteroscillospira sp.]